MLLHFGAEAGVDNMKLAACIDAKDPVPCRSQHTGRRCAGRRTNSHQLYQWTNPGGRSSSPRFYKLIDEGPMHDADKSADLAGRRHAVVSGNLCIQRRFAELALLQVRLDARQVVNFVNAERDLLTLVKYARSGVRMVTTPVYTASNIVTEEFDICDAKLRLGRWSFMVLLASGDCQLGGGRRPQGPPPGQGQHQWGGGGSTGLRRGGQGQFGEHRPHGRSGRTSNGLAARWPGRIWRRRRACCAWRKIPACANILV